MSYNIIKRCYITNKQIRKENFSLINFYLFKDISDDELFQYYKDIGLIKSLNIDPLCYININKEYTPKSEDFVKHSLCKYLYFNGYTILQCAYGHQHGTDILAIKDSNKEILKVEAKGVSFHGADGVNLNTAIGEILNVLSPGAKYMMAFPENTNLEKLHLKGYNQFKKDYSTYDLDKIFIINDAGGVSIKY